MRVLFPFALLIIALTGCSLLTNPSSYEEGEEVDGGGDDVGTDLSEADATSACVMACDGDLPYCLESEARCVACLDSTHCPDDGECRNGRCPECRNSSECMTPQAPVCAAEGPDEGRCVPCADATDCSGIRAAGVDLSVCHTPRDEPSVCVQCNRDEGECGLFVCDVLANECSREEPASTTICGECVSSAQCQPGRVCAQEVFGGTPTGYFCFPSAEEGCTIDRIPERDIWVSVEGEDVAVCHPTATTCEGLFGDEAPCEDDATCGLAGVDDSACVDERCTYYCQSSVDCRAEEQCTLDTQICVER